MEGGLEHKKGYSSKNGVEGDDGGVGADRGICGRLGMFEPTKDVGRIEEGRRGFRM